MSWKVDEFEEANLEDMLKEWDEAAARAAGFGDMIKSAPEIVKPSPVATSSKKNNKKNKRTNSKANWTMMPCWAADVDVGTREQG